MGWKGRDKLYIEILGVDFIMLREIEVFLGHKNTLW